MNDDCQSISAAPAACVFRSLPPQPGWGPWPLGVPTPARPRPLRCRMSRPTEFRAGENFPGSTYTDEEREFFKAIDRYRRLRRRPNLMWHEVLRVFKRLGYRKVEQGLNHRGAETRRKKRK